MLACLVLLVAATSWDSVSGECEFPPGHPVHSDGLSQSPVQVLGQGRVYVYSDTFGNCSGCVQALTYCYLPRSVASETLLTVEIRKDNEMVLTSYEVSVSPTYDQNDRSNCISDLLSNPHCCIHETLAEPFSVNYNCHYALKVPSGPTSLLLRHQTQLASGTQYRIDTNEIINSPLYKPLFFFTIDSTINNCNSAPGTDGPTDSSSNTTSISEPSTTNSSSTDTTATTVPTAPPDVTSSVPPGITDVGTDTGSQSLVVGAGVGVGVGAAVVLLVVVGVLGVGLFCVWRRRYPSKVVISTGNVTYNMSNMEMSGNVAYGVTNMEMSGNVAYGATKSASFQGEDTYDYISTTDGNDIITTSPNEAYAATDNVPVSSNQAYGMVHH